jgi:hypothetical protein
MFYHQMSDIYNVFGFAIRYHFLRKQFAILPNIKREFAENSLINAKLPSMFAHNIYVCGIDTVNIVLLH